ncbi:hypothetical protein GQ44DRAFT_719290 [Phaeosphaeriaceae sp. PMI808]|nr:hypothetical protein GQ44DRAFT_719290 [Phaeosphaeriaceae sp. PMI808]
MSQELLNTLSNGAQQQPPSKPITGQQERTASDFRPTRLQHQNSTAASSIGRYASTRPRPRNAHTNTASMGIQRTHTSRTNCTNCTNDLHRENERAEKKQEQTVDVDNDYFALNPWYSVSHHLTPGPT